MYQLFQCHQLIPATDPGTAQPQKKSQYHKRVPKLRLQYRALQFKRRSMSDLQARFAQAQQDVNALTERPDNNTMLELYALYKQATQGDATGEQPGSFDFVRRAKFDAWSAIKGTAAEDAMQQYIDLVASLRR
jgi:acyl-CoA-binding protein